MAAPVKLATLNAIIVLFSARIVRNKLMEIAYFFQDAYNVFIKLRIEGIGLLC